MEFVVPGGNSRLDHSNVWRGDIIQRRDLSPASTGRPPESLQPIPASGEVFGEVVSIEHIAAEVPDFDWCRFLTRFVWFGVFVLLPIAAFVIIGTHLGSLSLLLAIFVMWMLVKFLMPQNLWALIHMATVLNPFGRREATVPVRHLRVRTPEGWQVMVRMKGRPLRGSVMQEDDATFLGAWRGGVLFSKRAYVHRTRSWVEMEGAYSWVGLVISLIVLATLTYYVHAAITNVTARLPASL